MKEKKDFSLKDFNTFGVDVNAKYFCLVNDLDELKRILEKYNKEDLFVLGGGSNTLFVNDWDGLVIKLGMRGMKVLEKSKDFVKVFCSGGEEWDDFVNWVLSKGYSGIEKMLMIPGTVGGAISQNIGAYGQTISDVLFEIQVFDRKTKKEIILKPTECAFEYRSSKFKNAWRGRHIVIGAVFKLGNRTKKETLYSDMEFVKKQRNEKLPKIEEFGTCGSFFKNPFVTEEKYAELCEKILNLEGYPEKDFIKISAGKLLDELGWKGKWEGNVGVFERHALCVVTNKKARGEEIVKFIEKMKESVKQNYGIELVEEVNIVF